MTDVTCFEWEYRCTTDGFWEIIANRTIQGSVMDGVMIDTGDVIRLVYFEHCQSHPFYYRFARCMENNPSGTKLSHNLLFKKKAECIPDTSPCSMINDTLKAMTALEHTRVLYLGQWRQSDHWQKTMCLSAPLSGVHDEMIMGQIRFLWIQSSSMDVKNIISFFEFQYNLEHGDFFPKKPKRDQWIGIFLANISEDDQRKIENWCWYQWNMTKTKNIFVSRDPPPSSFWTIPNSTVIKI